jgi:preprotein translocase subunit SecE
MEKKPKNQKKLRIRKSPETVRERADKQSSRSKVPNTKLRSKIHRPLSVLRRAGQKEFNPVPVPNNKAGKILGKRFNLVPKFLKEAWAELRLVTWPSKKVAARLTGAVVMFAFIFAIFVQILDFLFNKLFKVILLK